MSASPKAPAITQSTGTDQFQASLHLVHGGLVTAAVVLCLVLFGTSGESTTVIRAAAPSTLPEEPPEIAPREEAAAAPAPATTLSASARGAMDYVSRRYRVSSAALPSIFGAAEKVGRQFQLDPMLILAVIAVESGFNPIAQSVMGAQGLMQVIPHYHRDKLPEKDGEVALLDPETNVRVGAAILRESITRMGDLNTGLQQFAGALDDPEEAYASRVMAEKQRLEQAARRFRAQ